MLGLKLPTRLRLKFSHVNEQKFWHNSEDPINLMCSCSFEPKTADQYLFCCKILFDLRKDLLNSLFAMSKSLKIFSDEQLLNVLLYGSEKFIFSANTKILRPAIKFLKTECLECLLFQTQLSVDIFARVTIFFYFLFPVFVSFCDFS